MPQLLTKEELRQTFGPTMINISGREDETSPEGVIDIAPYCQAIPDSDLGDHKPHDLEVDRVYRTSDDRYDHVLLMTHSKNIYMVVVIDLQQDRILGHHVLDLNKEYGVEQGDAARGGGGR